MRQVWSNSAYLQATGLPKWAVTADRFKDEPHAWRDFGLRGDGVETAPSDLQAFLDFLADTTMPAAYYDEGWKPGRINFAGNIVLPDIMTLEELRGFVFVGQGAIHEQSKTTLRVIRNDAEDADGHPGVLEILSGTNIDFERMEFIAHGMNNAPDRFNQAVLINANADPDRNYEIDAVDDETDTLSFAVPFYIREGQPIRFTSDDTLPAPLEIDTTYYAKNVDATSCQVAATQGGPAIDITDTGAGTHTLDGRSAVFYRGLSNLQMSFKFCSARRLGFTNAEFALAAMHVVNSGMLRFENCQWLLAAKAFRLGAAIGEAPDLTNGAGGSAAFGAGRVTQIDFQTCYFGGDVERANVSAASYRHCFFQLKTGTNAPSCLTIATASQDGSELAASAIRTGHEKLEHCEVDETAVITDKTRTFYTQGESSLSRGVEARQNRIGSVAIGFDITKGYSTIVHNQFTNAADGAIAIRIGAAAVNMGDTWPNDCSAMVGTGAQPIDDNRASVEHDGHLAARQPSSNFVATQTNAFETAFTFAAVVFPGGKVRMSWRAVVNAHASASAIVKMRIAIAGTAIDASLVRHTVTAGTWATVQTGMVIVNVDAGSKDVTIQMEQTAADPNFPTVYANHTNLGGSFLLIEKI